MKKVKKFVIICLFVICLLVQESQPIVSAYAADKGHQNNFSIDVNEYDVYWYPTDTRSVWGTFDGHSRVVATVFLVCGVAVDKNDPTQQTMLVKTETRPNTGMAEGNNTYDALNAYISVTWEAGINGIKDAGTYTPIATPVSGTSTTSGGASSTVTFGKNTGVSFGGSFTQSTTVPIGGCSIVVNYNSKESERTITYKYNSVSTFLWAGSTINQALSNNFIQTYSFDYKYTGSNTVPKNHIVIKSHFKVGKYIGKSFNGSSMYISGDYTDNYSFYLGGF